MVTAREKYYIINWNKSEHGRTVCFEYCSSSWIIFVQFKNHGKIKPRAVKSVSNPNCPITSNLSSWLPVRIAWPRGFRWHRLLSTGGVFEQCNASFVPRGVFLFRHALFVQLSIVLDRNKSCTHATVTQSSISPPSVNKQDDSLPGTC